MQHTPANLKKILITLTVLALIVTTINSIGITQAATARQSHSTATSAPIIFQRSIQPNTLQTNENPAVEASNSKNTADTPKPHPSGKVSITTPAKRLNNSTQSLNWQSYLHIFGSKCPTQPYAEQRQRRLKNRHIHHAQSIQSERWSAYNRRIPHRRKNRWVQDKN